MKISEIGLCNGDGDDIIYANGIARHSAYAVVLTVDTTDFDDGEAEMTENKAFGVVEDDSADREYSAAVLSRPGFYRMTDREREEADAYLRISADGISLVGGGQEMRGDFSHMISRLKLHNLQGELIVKAVKIKGHEGTLRVLDATAGMGEDSLLLAAAGCYVDMYEYDRVIALLLTDTLRRAKECPELSEAVGRMTLTEGDSIDAMKHLDSPPDVILLDPMFPERQKSGLVKKKFQLIHKLEKPCGDEIELLGAAMDSGAKKIVIKRPLKGKYLADKKPSYSLLGKAIRYDCIVL